MSQRAAELLRVVHNSPGVTRADAAKQLGIGTGLATEIVAGLVAGRLVAERPAQRTGTRGRPTAELVAHDDGPLVLAASLTHEDWRLRVVELGGNPLAQVGDNHAGARSPDVLADIAAAATKLRRRFPKRVRAMAVSAPGTIENTTLVHATSPNWREVELQAIWPRAQVFVAGNDATLAATAEATRGAAASAVVSLHVRVQAGIGGAVIDRGRALIGAHGLGGEFGHMPFGDPSRECPCGAFGCWGTTVDGTALARLIGDPDPKDPDAYTRRTIGKAARDPKRAGAVRIIAAALGRGIAGLVNAVDPDAVTIGGSGADVLAAEPAAVEAAYRAGQMRYRRPALPELRAAALGEDGPLVGAAELAWNTVWGEL